MLSINGIKCRLFVGVLLTILASSSVFAEEGAWYPSKYGAADTIGALNNLRRCFKCRYVGHSGKNLRIRWSNRGGYSSLWASKFQSYYVPSWRRG